MREDVAGGVCDFALTDWKKLRLSDLAQYHNGVAFKPADWVEDGLPIIRIEQLNNPDGEFDRYAGLVAENNRIRNGDLIFSWSATLKAIIWRHGDAVLNQHLFKVVPKPNIDIHFLHFVLDFNMEALGNSSHGSTMKHIKPSELDKFFVAAPSTVRQRKIAAILSTIDTAIEQTEALVEKYQRIKAGLMHDLFTRGVLPNGQLRPPREQAPELYQETSIGWIPREWQAIRLGNILVRIDAGWSPECQETPPGIGERGVLKVSAVTRGVYDSSESKVLPRKLRPDPSIEVADGDVVLTRANGVAALVGVTVQVKNTPSQLMLSDKLLRLVPLESVMTKSFLTFVMQTSFIKTQIDGVMSGSSGQRNIAQSQIRNFVCGCPPRKEQLLVETRLQAIELALEKETLRQQKLGVQKLGLMQDLLTGKVSVQ